MDVHKSSLLAVFDAKQRLEVPLFQRQYVWNEEEQWLPLWEDIARKFGEALEGRADAPVHFLGAMVLDQKQTPTGHVVVRQVIDGQQRLTTLQIFLAAFRDFSRQQGCSALAEECDKFLFNTGMMADPEVDRFKVWPTQLDRGQFTDVVGAGSHEELLRRHPLRRKPYARKPDPRPRMVEAYLYFFEQFRRFFLGEEAEPPLSGNVPVEARMDECFQTLRRALMVVVIDLQKDDDPQVIFETLNARGQPLLPADLLRNYIFFRVGRAKLDAEAAYEKYWAHFDDEFWREEVKQGRLTRPRSDLFMQHFLASHQGQDIPIKHLYVEYRHWIEAAQPFADVEAELATLARQGKHFRSIIAPQPGEPTHEISVFLDAFDIRTAYPLLLALMDANLEADEWARITEILESYLLRRAICDLGTKNYNKVFLALTRSLRRDGFSSDRLRELLLAGAGGSTLWPSDDQFREAWLRTPSYGPLSNAKLVHILGRLNRTFMSAKSEPVVFTSTPTVEHIMPQSWQRNWPLPDGTKGLDWSELYSTPAEDERAVATRARSAVLQTMGNLTLLSSSLNAAQSNAEWATKKPALGTHSLLPINLDLQNYPVWDEAAIERRGQDLFSRALTIWHR
jgi:hypothetical protein